MANTTTITNNTSSWFQTQGATGSTSIVCYGGGGGGSGLSSTANNQLYIGPSLPSLEGRTVEFENKKYSYLKDINYFLKPDTRRTKILIDNGYLDSSRSEFTCEECLSLGGNLLYLHYDVYNNILEMIKIKHPNHKATYLNSLYKDNFTINHQANLTELSDDNFPLINPKQGIIPSLPITVAHLSGILNTNLRPYSDPNKFVTIYDKTCLRPAQRKFCGMYSYLRLRPKEEVYDLCCEYHNSDKRQVSINSFLKNVCIPETKIQDEVISELITQLSLNTQVKDLNTCASILILNLLFSSLDHV